MRVTTKGQVTIPQQVREQMGIGPGSEVEIVAREGHAEIRLVSAPQVGIRAVLDRMRGAAGPGMTTDEVMELTRGEPG
jgi:antitoxin PrlF